MTDIRALALDSAARRIADLECAIDTALARIRTARAAGQPIDVAVRDVEKILTSWRIAATVEKPASVIVLAEFTTSGEDPGPYPEEL